MKKAGTKMEPDWSKRSDMQYAYKKVMDIHPDVIKEIESDRELFRVVYESKNEKPTGISNVDKIFEYYEKMYECMTPKFPEIPENLTIRFVFAQGEHQRMFSVPEPLLMSTDNYKAFQKALEDDMKKGG